VALSFIMVLALLVYRLAEHLLRSRLAETEETVPNQVNKPTKRPTKLRNVGISIHPIGTSQGFPVYQNYPELPRKYSKKQWYNFFILCIIIL